MEVIVKKKFNVYIIGASGFGREIESWISLSNNFKNRFLIKGYLDDNIYALDSYPSRYKVLGKIDDFQFQKNKDFVLLAIADPTIKESIVGRLKNKVNFLSFIFSNVIIGKNVTIGEGTIIAPNCVLSTNINIGPYVTINLGTHIGHDSTISDFSSIMANVDISGSVKIGESVFIGSNATIVPRIIIGDKTKITAGSIVLNNLPEYSFVFGNPAKKMSKPIIKPRIFLSSPHMGGAEQKYIQDAFDSNWIAPLGPNVDNFEDSIVKYCGVKYAAALNSGTAAIHLALILLGVDRGDEVIASSLTFSATLNPIVYLGATPVMVDSEPGTWNICPETLEIAIKSRLSKGRKPKAIIPVHLYGMPANMEKIMEIANRYEIPVIEDAAEALGSRYNDKQVGTIGKIGILSFNGNKIITTSGGGAIISDDKELITKARFLSKQAREIAPHYQHTEVGYNYRISNILAGIGLGQMEVIDKRVIQRRDNFDFYKKNLGKIEGISFQEEPDNSFFPNHWLTTILIDPEETGKTWLELQAELEKENIESRPLWKPMHLQPIFSTFPAYLNGTSEELFSKGLCLPSGSNMTEKDRMKVLNTIINFFTK